MADRSRFDPNNRNSLFVVSNADGETPVTLWADPTTHALITSATVIVSGTSDVNLAEVGGAPFSLGQQLAAASLPIVLTAAQLSTLTPLSTVAVTQSTSPWVVSGTVAATQSGTWAVGSNSATGSAVPANAFLMGVSDGTNLIAARATKGDAATDSGVLNGIQLWYNGATYDRARSATAASNTTGTGLLGTAILGFDGTNYQRVAVDANKGLSINLLDVNGTALSVGNGTSNTGTLRVTVASNSTGTLAVTGGTTSGVTFAGVLVVGMASGSSNTAMGLGSANSNFAGGDGNNGSGILAVHNEVYNGTTYNYMRSATAAAATTGTGLLGTAILGFDGTNYQRVAVDANKNLDVTLGTKLDQVNDAVTTYPFGHSYAHISTSTTTTVKSGAGVLHNISVNTLGTVASTTTIYDNTAGSGTVIGVINTLTLSGSFVLDVAFSTGLTLVTTGTVAPDITVSYR